MVATVTILYPAEAKFNMDYYLSSHMPMVQKTWGPEGLQHWKVLKFGSDSAYSVQATLEFSDKEAFQKAASGETAKKVFGDVPNFSDKNPTVLIGEVMGEQSSKL